MGYLLSRQAPSVDMGTASWQKRSVHEQTGCASDVRRFHLLAS